MRIIYKIRNVYFHIVVNKLAASYIMPQKLRNFLLNVLGIKSRGFVSPHVYFGNNNVQLGTGSFVNIFCYFDDNGFIKIGNHTHVGQYVRFCTSSHEIGLGKAPRAGRAIHGTITVADNCWIGIGATILANVIVGNGCIIAAGSVVTKDCLPDGLYAGIPAKRIKDLSLVT